MSYRYMRMLVMFDLPTEKSDDRKAYRKFRKFLLNEGFLMHQYSVYSKILLNDSASKAMLARLEKNSPIDGLVTVLTITEKQFSRMVYLSGEKDISINNSDKRLIFLGESYD